MRKRNIFQQPTVLISVTVLILLLVFGYTLWNHYGSSRKAQQSIATAAPLLTHAEFDNQTAILVTLMKHQGMQSAFDYVTEEMTRSPSFAKDCHPLLHQLGHDAFVYYGNFASAIKYQNELCNSGYTHGVLEAYLSRADLQSAIQTACASSPGNAYDAWQCYHGLGHGIMQASLEKVDSSLDICKALQASFARDACANGVLMEHFVVEDHDGDIPKSNPTSLTDCTSITNPTYTSYCYLYAPTAYLTIHDAQYANALKWCNQAGSGYTSICIEGVGSQAMKDNIDNQGVVKAVCQLATAPYRGSCVSGAVAMYINYAVSSSAAEKLCNGEFSDRSSSCQAAIAFARQTYGI